MTLIERYVVNINNGSIVYSAKNKCDDCGYTDNDDSFFYEKGAKFYCSLHLGNE